MHVCVRACMCASNHASGVLAWACVHACVCVCVGMCSDLCVGELQLNRSVYSRMVHLRDVCAIDIGHKVNVEARVAISTTKNLSWSYVFRRWFTRRTTTELCLADSAERKRL